MEFWTEVRRRVLTGQLSKRAACREYGINWRTLTKILEFVEPPGYRLSKPRHRPKIEAFLPIIDQMLKSDQRAPASSVIQPIESSRDCVMSTISAAVIRS